LREDILAELEGGIELQALSLRERVQSRRSWLGRVALAYGWYITLADMVDEGLIVRRVEEGVLGIRSDGYRVKNYARYFYRLARKDSGS
jgi:hypothetical protein